ncbi:MAG: aminotransferase class III-fold pyridoxal phosphate-dependent enzyme [Chthonomonas sp.]|nr:aminotransferase class III-fold pyridoxal phosphate-dependent enzyme [Chthonomonas sp.]
MPFLAGSDAPTELDVYARLPVEIVRGAGCQVWDSNGKVYLDFYGGHAVTALGYAHPALTAAIQSQAQQLIFQTNAVDVAIRREALATLASVAPLGHAFLVNSGAEANENALRLAFLHTGRTRVTCLQGGFHGRTAAAGAVTDHNASWYAFPQTPFAVDRVPINDIAALDQAMTDDTAAVIFEPVQGVAGAVECETAFLQAAARLAKERGILLIADEVQTGVGRCGTMFAVEHAAVQPDILTVAKGLGGGIPVAAVLCSAPVAAVAKRGMLGTTFGGGPVACAAMQAVLHAVSAPGFLGQVRERSEQLIHGCLQAGVRQVTGRGLLLGLHLDTPAAPVRTELLQRGFLTGDAKNPNIVRLLPPLIISASDVGAFTTALREVLA